MFLRTLSYIVTVILVTHTTFVLFNKLENRYIVPIVCIKTMYRAKIHIMENGRGYYEHPVDVALDSERFIRSMCFLAINLVMIILIAVFVPGGLGFWVIPDGAIKFGLIFAFAVNAFQDLIYSFQKKMVVGTLDWIDDDGFGHFSGTWVPDFKVDIKKFFDDECPPIIGQKYLFMAYNNSTFCWARLETVIIG